MDGLSPISHDEYNQILNLLSSQLPTALFHVQATSHLQISYYFCNPVMDFAAFLRTFSKAAQLSSQHDTFKHLFNRIVFHNAGQTEVKVGSRRVDILVPETNQSIEIKTISEISMEKLYNKAIGVIEAQTRISDYLWVFYFYKLAEPVKTHPNCKYLLVYININIMGLDLESFRTELIDMVEEGKEQVAEKLQIRPALIIPLENLIKVEDLERLVEEKDDEIHLLREEKVQVIVEKDQVIEEKDQVIEEKVREIRLLREELNHLKQIRE